MGKNPVQGRLNIYLRLEKKHVHFNEKVFMIPMSLLKFDNLRSCDLLNFSHIYAN